MVVQKLDKLVLVTRRTRLEELTERFNTRGQAKFYIEHSRGNFDEYQREHDAYQRALERLQRDLDLGMPRQVLDRAIVPTYTFGPHDVVVTLGQDGLVANVAKYALDLPIVGVNPDPERFDGVLLPFLPGDAKAAVLRVLDRTAKTRAVTLAEIRLEDGQRMLAFNDLFIGASTHASARYRIAAHGAAEAQSSSGVLISTGAGSTGWMSSVFNMAAGVTAFTSAESVQSSKSVHSVHSAHSIQGGRSGQSSGSGQRDQSGQRGATASRPLAWEDPRLIFAVREPFVSRHSAASIVAGFVQDGEEIRFESLMPSGGVIFSDGIESDFLQFNAGAIGRARRAKQHAMLVVR